MNDEKKRQEDLAKEIRGRNVYTMGGLEDVKIKNSEIPGIVNVSRCRDIKEKKSERAAESRDQSSGTNISTIGNTFIPPTEREMIRDEVRAVMHQNFPGIQFGTVHNSESGNSGASAAQVTKGGTGLRIYSNSGV